MNNEKEENVLIDDLPSLEIEILLPGGSFRNLEEANNKRISKFSSEDASISITDSHLCSRLLGSSLQRFFSTTIDFALFSAVSIVAADVFTSGFDYLKFRGGRLIGAWRASI